MDCQVASWLFFVASWRDCVLYFVFLVNVDDVLVPAGEGELGEAGVWEAGRAEAVGDASRRRPADDPRGREVAADVWVPVTDLVQSGAGGNLRLDPEGLQLCQHGVNGHQLNGRTERVPMMQRHHHHPCCWSANPAACFHDNRTQIHTHTHTCTHTHTHTCSDTPSPSDWSSHDALHWKRLLEGKGRTWRTAPTRGQKVKNKEQKKNGEKKLQEIPEK